MCVDFIDLNKACPKDSYLLLNIDQLMDRTFGYRYLSFMDAYSKHNQIQMHLDEKEKTTFITDNANFCYRIMSFRLKNARVTYQWLMNEVFAE